ncbi:hypothetical protein PHLCEN_2v4764 [Hermanssonia centrifuga]|uniref:Uncharacterized protein n=1 Tax=Hermanssonia centrifuga TaxID=98765 RepID=A0A2R6PJJ9_9APHY|nr:hypothetical protein PHLCEN_2v4764 [Hermanssonia centrifuga]
MAEYNSTALIVDDRDPTIQYSAGWQQVTGAPAPADRSEYLFTKTGAAAAGLTARFTFNGTGVEVYGSQGSFDVYGQPVTSYTVDGSSYATYQTPVIPSPEFTVHTLFYRSPPLPAGEHELLVTNMNGTQPNLYWLDYILYTPSIAAPQPPSGPLTSSPSSPASPSSPQSSNNVGPASSPSSSPSIPQPNQSSTPASFTASSFSTESQESALLTNQLSKIDVSSSSSASGSPTSPASITLTPTGLVTATETPGSVSSTSKTSTKAFVAAIAGGVIGGVVIVVSLMLLWLWYRRRQPRTTEYLQPFGSWPAGQNADTGLTSATSEKLITNQPIPREAYTTVPSSVDTEDGAVSVHSDILPPGSDGVAEPQGSTSASDSLLHREKQANHPA